MKTQRLFQIWGLLVAVLLACGISFGQDDPSYKKWLQEQEKKYKEYRDERDRQFSEFLKKEWASFDLSKGVPRETTPKPKAFPKAPEADERPEPETPPVSIRIPEPSRVPPVDPSAEVPAEAAGAIVEFNFYESTMKLPKGPLVVPQLAGPADQKAIAEFWSALGREPYPEYVETLQRKRRLRLLNDWAYVKFVHQAAGALAKGRQNESLLLTWFLLVKSGLDIRVGYTHGQVALLMNSRSPIYNVRYFEIPGRPGRYYVLSFSPEGGAGPASLYTYKDEYPDALAPVDLYLQSLPILAPKIQTRALEFTYEGKRFQCSAQVRLDQVGFLREYPVTDFDVYYRSPISQECMQSLLPPLGEFLKGRQERDAINALLRFVQTAFPYQTDDEQFGREKPMFPEETLHYPYSDCEDRAVLFAFLVRELLGLTVVGLQYPGHMATGILTTVGPGDVTVSTKGGKRFVVADPTYINANLGMCMPEFKATVPTVLEFNQ